RRHTRSTRDWSSDVCSSDLFFGDHATFAFEDQLFFQFLFCPLAFLLGNSLCLFNQGCIHQFLHFGSRFESSSCLKSVDLGIEISSDERSVGIWCEYLVVVSL